MNIEGVALLISSIADILTTVAVVTGGLWALYHFRLFREWSSIPQLKLDYTLLDYNDKSKLLVAIVKVMNISKVLVNPTEINFSLKILPDNYAIGQTLHWNDGDDAGNVIIRDYDVIKQSNPDHDMNVYMLEPGDEFPELLTVVVPANAFMMAQVTYVDKEGNDFWIYEIIKS